MSIPELLDPNNVATVQTVESAQTGAIKAFVTTNLFVSILMSLSLGQMIGALNAV